MLSGSLNCSALLETAALQALRKLENCSLHLRFSPHLDLPARRAKQLHRKALKLQCTPRNSGTSGPAKASKLQSAPAIPVPLQSSPHLDLPARRAKQLHRKAPKLQCTPRNSSTSGPAKASKPQSAPAIPVPLQSSPHLDLPARRAKQLHRKAPKLQCAPRNSSTSGPAKASNLPSAAAIPVPLQSSPHLDLPGRRAKQLHRKTPKLQCTPRKSSTSGPAKASKLQSAPRCRVPLQPSSDRLQAGLPAAVCSSGTRLHHWLHRGDPAHLCLQPLLLLACF